MAGRSRAFGPARVARASRPSHSGVRSPTVAATWRDAARPQGRTDERTSFVSDIGTVGTPSAPSTPSGAVQASGPAAPPGAAPSASAAEQARFTELSAQMPASVPALFLQRVAQTPHREAYQCTDGVGGWRSISWSETSPRTSSPR